MALWGDVARRDVVARRLNPKSAQSLDGASLNDART